MNWEILLKYINNESDLTETKRVEEWLNQQAENRQLFNYLQKRKEQLEQPLKQSDIHQQWVLLLDRIFEAKQTPDKPSSNNGYRFIGIAASLLLVATMGWFLRTKNTSIVAQTILVQTPFNQRGHLTLPDSSEVYLAPNSKLTYTTAFGLKKRELHLTGEAFFNVKHIVKKPFIVSTQNNLSVTVLGTSFNIYSRVNQNTEVKVATGLVGVLLAKQTKFLSAGQQLVYQAATGRIATSSLELKEAVALQNQSLFFKNNNTEEIAEKLRRWYNINIEVLPTAHKHARFSGEMKDSGIDNLLKGLSYATGLKYQYKNAHTLQLL